MPFRIALPGSDHRSRRVSAIVAVVVTLVVSTGCAGSSVEAPADRYATVVDLGTAVRDRLTQDGTVGFTFRTDGAENEVNLSGEGSFRIDPAEVSSRHDLVDTRPASGATPQMEQMYEMRTFGGEVYFREGSATWETLDLTTGGGVATLLPFNGRWMTRLPAVAGAFELDGAVEEQRDSGQVVEYRLSGDYLEASTLALRDMRLPPREVQPGTPALPLTLDLVVDGSDRLVSARFTLLAEGELLTFDYDFRDWGEPVEIERPPAG